ncbi:MAG: FAD-dependent oxidoreductase [Chloroflexota bacterium]|nr:FAD-dependent oxidoreductase [Chloroflexota bacterium]
MGIRKVNYERCTGCATCVEECPMDVIRLDRSINKDEMPPCQAACPAGMSMRDYIYLVVQRRFEEAAALVRNTLVLPGVTGRVCFHPCEEDCARRKVDEAVNIRSLERFVTDYALESAPGPVPKLHNEKIAVVGSGPCGLAAASELARKGYPVTVFEALPVLGGMLRAGIPEYRLPRDVLEREIDSVIELGVKTLTSTPVCDLESLFATGYKAVLLAIGAAKSRNLAIPGEDATGVAYGLDFLRDFNLGKGSRLEGKVAVIGGGNVAVDAARLALRTGASQVTIIYRRSRAEMPAIKEEVKEALAEGVRTKFLAAPVQITRENGGLCVTCTRMKLGKKGADGRRQPEPVPDSEFDITADRVIIAAGEEAEVPSKWGLKLKRGAITTDPTTLATSRRGVFAGGDAVTGPGYVIQAIASGKKAAAGINCYLRGEQPGFEEARRVNKPPLKGVDKKARNTAAHLGIAERRNQAEVEAGFSPEMALKEADRCMACGSKAFIKYLRDCMTCFLCEIDCPEEAIYVSPERERRKPLPW